MVTRAHIHIEHELQLFLERQLLRPKEIEEFSLTYATRVRLALALGLDIDLKGPLILLGKLRNRFAHKLGTKLSDKDAKDLFSSFGATGQEIIRTAFKKLKKRRGQPHDIENLTSRECIELCLVSLRSAVVAEFRRISRS